MDHLDPEAVIRRYAPTVYRLAAAQLHSRQDADDVLQEVFLRYLRKTPAFDSEEHRKAWLLRVTVNCCRKVQLSPWRLRTAPLSDLLPAPEAEETGMLELLEALPAKYRSVLHLFYYEGYSVEEIGAILERKPSTVRCQLTRGRALLRDQLEGENRYE